MQTEPETVQSIIAEIARTLGYSTGAVPTQIDEKKARDVLGIKVSALTKSNTTSKSVCSPGRHDRRSMMILFAVIISGMGIFAACSGISSLPAPAFHERKQTPPCAHVVSQKFANEISIKLFQIEIKLQLKNIILSK